MQVIQDDGSPCRPKSAIIRELGYFVDAMFFGVIGYFAMRDDPEQKRHGDTWADTIVCKRANLAKATSKQDEPCVIHAGACLKLQAAGTMLC